MKKTTNTVFYYLCLAENGREIVDTKYVYSSVFGAIARGRALKKQYRAARVRIENADNFRVYWI